MSKENYIKESDLFKAMENNSHTVEVFGTKRKMIDGMLLTYDIAEFERLNVEEIRNKAIDEFAEKLCNVCSDNSSEFYFGNHKVDVLTLDGITEIAVEIAEQLKGGGNNED